MDFKDLAVKYFKFHNEPLLKIELPSHKFFLEPPKEHEKEYFQNILSKSLEYVRVERRCARSRGIWSEEKAMCKITKVVGNILKNFGFQDKTGIYLLPEETLFLLEQNKLELTYNSKQVTIYEMYSLLSSHISLKKYRVYKKLVEQGFKLLDIRAIRKFYTGQKKVNDEMQLRNNKKRKKIADFNETDYKIKRILSNTDNLSDSASNLKNNENDNFLALFEKLRKHGPKIVLPSQSSRHPDYFGFLPSSGCKHSHEFNLYIRESIQSNDFNNYEHVPNIFAVVTNDKVTFCRYPNVNIPIINDLYLT